MPKMTEWRTGVYCWLNKVNGKRYIGSGSRSISHRYNHYILMLPRGKCHNRYLQRAWDKYGSEAFEFIILERCAPEDCVGREQYWLDHYWSYQPAYGYNISPTAGSNLGVKHTEEFRRKVSENIRKRVVRDETRAKRSATLMGHPVSDEARAKISAARTGKKLSEETRRKISLAGIGRTHTVSAETRARMAEIAKARPPMSQETRQKISALSRGKKHTQETRAKIAKSARLAHAKRRQEAKRVVEVQGTIWDE